MKRAMQSLSVALGMLMVAACTADDPISRVFPCRFVLDTQVHPASKIVTALTATGYWVRTTVGLKNGVPLLTTYSRDGQNNPEQLLLTTETERRAYSPTIAVGANQQLIIGNTNFNGSVAYDAMCPNCVQSYGMTNYPLAWAGSVGEVSCANCKRTYSLETGGVTAGAAGNRLMQYRVVFAGLGSVVTIAN